MAGFSILGKLGVTLSTSREGQMLRTIAAVWFFGLLLVSVAGAAAPVSPKRDHVETVKKAVVLDICSSYFWGGEDWSYLKKDPVTWRAWVDDNSFVAQLQYLHPLHGPSVEYFLGCFAEGGEALIRNHVGWPEELFTEDVFREWVQEWAKEWEPLIKGVRPVVGTLWPIDCSNPFGEYTPTKGVITAKLVEVIRKELNERSHDCEDRRTLAQETVRIGDFDVTSDSVWVLLEGLEEVWQIKLIRPERCGEADVLPMDYMVARTSRIPKRADELALTSPVNPHLLKQLRVHSVTRTIRLRE